MTLSIATSLTHPTKDTRTMELITKAKANRVSALQLVEASRRSDNIVTLRPTLHMVAGGRSAARSNFESVA